MTPETAYIVTAQSLQLLAWAVVVLGALWFIRWAVDMLNTRGTRVVHELNTDETDALQAQLDDLRAAIDYELPKLKDSVKLAHDNNGVNRRLLNLYTPPNGALPQASLTTAELQAAARPYNNPVPAVTPIDDTSPRGLFNS